MSDDSKFTPLDSPLTLHPFYQLQIKAIEKLQENGNTIYDLRGRKLDIDSLLDSNFFEDIYYEVGLIGESVDSFKSQLRQGINCGLVAGTMALPGQPVVKHNMCKLPFHAACAAYRSRVEKTRYPANTVAISQSYDQPAARDLVGEINKLTKSQDVNWLFAVDTPLHDGRSLVRIINLKIHEMNPLEDMNETKKIYAEFMIEYPQFEQVYMTSDPDSGYEVRYITADSKIEFTSTQLWTSRPTGQSGSYTREGGKIPGWEFDHELGEVVHYTKDQKKTKRREEQGIIGYVNAPVINLNGVTLEALIDSFEETLEEICPSGDKAVFSASEHHTATHTAVDIIATTRDKLQLKGFQQDDTVYIDLPIYQEKFDEYLKTLSTGMSIIPSNINEIEFTPDMLDMQKAYGLKDRRRVIRNSTLARAQKIIREAPTKREMAEKLARFYLKLE